MALPGNEPIYGKVFNVTGIPAGATCSIERDTSGAFGSAVVIASVSEEVQYTDILPNDGVTRYYRARVTLAGYVTSAYSSTISGAPVRLNGLV
jgi:hypothetical protein